MRRLITVLALGVVLALPCRLPAEEPDDGEDDAPAATLRQQLEALDDLKHAETDEEADEAEKRFDDAAAREVRRRRKTIDDLIER